MTKKMGRLAAVMGMATLVAGLAGVAQSKAEAATATSSFAVTATVAANCTISAGALAFGSYDPVVANAAANLDQTSTITVACTKGSTAAVSLDNGANASGSTRRMKAGANYLTYEMYNDSGRTTVWNTSNTVSYTAASKAASALTLYGRVAAGQDIPTGSYSDTVVATITF
jgi:spore coat protein U domain-containing protein, fimbrial subunit CupE1/2/3/6